MGNEVSVTAKKTEALQRNQAGNSVTAKKTDALQINQAGKDGKLCTIIEDLKRNQTQPRVVLKVDRSNLINSTLPHFKMPKCELHPLDVQLMSRGVDEEVLNLGGPNREFFTLLLNKFKRSKLDMFEGKGGFLLPVNNQKAIDAELFYYFGKILVLSTINDGPGFPHFPHYVISYLREQEFMHELTTQNIVNTFLTNYISKVCQSESQDQLDKVIGDDEERFLDNSGWPRTDRIKLSNRLLYVQTLLKWELVDKRERALKQMKAGLSTFKYLDRVGPLEEFELLYLCRNKRETTAEFVREKLIPEVQKLKPEGGDEEKAKRFTLKCLDMLEDKEASHLFQFITGLDDVPVTEFTLQAEFNRNNRKAVLPEAITCIQRLVIPLGNKTQLEYYSSFEKALRYGRLGFSESV